jgi:hypothetical protein
MIMLEYCMFCRDAVVLAVLQQAWGGCSWMSHLQVTHRWVLFEKVCSN